MNILLITPYIPYPLSEGGKISQYALIDYMRKVHVITMVLIVYSETDRENISTLEQIWPDIKIETINYIEKEKKSFIKVLKNKTKKLISLNKKSEEHIRVSEIEDPYLTNFSQTKSRKFADDLYNKIYDKKFDLIQVDHTVFIDIADLLPINIKKIFVHHEIRFARLQSSLSNFKIGMYESYILNSVKRSEVSYLNEYDATFVFSEIDKTKLLSAGVQNVYNSPFPILEEYFVPISNTYADIKKLVFIGGEEHAPNKDAVDWYINDIAPLVAKYSDIKLHVIGKWSISTINELSKNKHIHFSGFVEDIISYCQDSVMVVPVRIGSGIRTKILYAMAQGTPIISASIGCEGIPLVNKKSIIIADSALSFAESIIMLITEPELCYNLASEAYEIAVKNYSQKAVMERRNYLYDKIHSNL